MALHCVVFTPWNSVVCCKLLLHVQTESCEQALKSVSGKSEKNVSLIPALWWSLLASKSGSGFIGGTLDGTEQNVTDMTTVFERMKGLKYFKNLWFSVYMQRQLKVLMT